MSCTTLNLQQGETYGKGPTRDRPGSRPFSNAARRSFVRTGATRAKTHAAPAAPSAVITAAEVIAKSSEVTSFLGTIAEKFVPSAEIDKIERSLPEVTRQIDLDFTDTSVTLGEQPPLTTIQAEQARWQYRHLQVTGWLTVLTQRGVELRTAYDALSRTARTWTQTRTPSRPSRPPRLSCSR